MKSFLLALCCAVSGMAIADTPAPSTHVTTRGGSISKPVAVDDLVYLATGSTITIWRRGAGGALEPVGDTRQSPLNGGITSLQRQGDYLFASFGSYSSSGVAVLSIAERTQPVLLATFDYTHNPYSRPAQLIVLGSQLYLFDEETGLYSSSLSDPLNLQFHSLGLFQWVNEGRYDVVGQRLYNAGMSNNEVLGAWDVSNPASPTSLGFVNFPCCDVIGLRVRGDYAFSFGEVFSVLDVTQVSSPVVVAELPAVGWGGFDSVLLDRHAWSVQPDAIKVIDISQPLQPIFRGEHAFLAPELDTVERAGDSVLVTEHSNRLQRLAADAEETPTVTAQHWLPGSAQPWAYVLHGDRLLTAEFYGIGILDADSLARLGYQKIPFNGYGQGGVDIVAEGDRAYVMHVRNGFSVVDISDPDQLQPLGNWRGEMHALAVRAGVVYVSHWGGAAPGSYQLSAIDMNEPAAPVPLSMTPLAEASSLVVRGNRLFVGHDYSAPTQELQILDISNPAAPQLLGDYDACPVMDLTTDDDGGVVYLVCGDRLEIVDVHDPAHPVLLHRRDGVSWTGGVAFHDGRLYLYQDDRLVELDVTDPAQPVVLAQTPSASLGKMQISRDARLYALSAGIQVRALDRLFRDGLEP